MSLPSSCVRFFSRISPRRPTARALCTRGHFPGNSGSSGLREDRWTRSYTSSSQEKFSNSSGGYNKQAIIGFTAVIALAVSIYGVRTALLKPESTNSGHLTDPSPQSTNLGTNYASPEELKRAIQELQTSFPGEHLVETNAEVLQLYGSSENSYHPALPHSVVVRVHSTEDVVKVVNISRKYRVPITAYSGATSLEGHFAGVCYILFCYIFRKFSQNICTVSLR